MKNKIKEKKHYGKIIDIDDYISIYADSNQFIVKYGNHNCFFTSLEQCFIDIFETKTKFRLIESAEKDMKRIIEIHEEVRKWLKSIFRTIENPRL